MTPTSLLRGLKFSILPIVIVAFVAALGAYFYVRAEVLMAGQVRQRLQSIASVAATQIDAGDIVLVRTAADVESPAHHRLVEHLQRIRAMTPGVRYAYLVRRTADPSIVTFIADADEFLSESDLDRDGNTIVDEDEAPAAPGEEYDIAGMTQFQEGFDHPSVDTDVTYDRWGALISGYAPVRDASGTTVALLGIDMSADEFLGIARSIFSPVALLLVVIAGAMLASLSFSIMQRRRYEALQHLETERTALLNLATHQLGMPLATFRWWLELIRERDGNTEDHEAFDQLQLGVDRMDHIVRSLQEAANLQTGGMQYHAELVDPLTFAHDVVDSMRPAFDLKRQHVEIISEQTLPQVTIDRKLISGVLSELLENARGYSPVESLITVRLTADKSKVSVSVEDRGAGIPAEDLPNIFRKFTRAKNAYANKPVGNGLGLYICKGIVERGGGTITIRSREGKGTTVTMTLPVAA